MGDSQSSNDGTLMLANGSRVGQQSIINTMLPKAISGLLFNLEQRDAGFDGIVPHMRMHHRVAVHS